MSPKQAYAEKLKDPRWQKKRLKIMERDGFICRFCLGEEKTLHVHHLRYEKDAEPWDYQDSWLITLCEDCHKEETELRKDTQAELLELIDIKRPISVRTLRQLINILNRVMRISHADVGISAMEGFLALDDPHRNFMDEYYEMWDARYAVLRDLNVV